MKTKWIWWAALIAVGTVFTSQAATSAFSHGNRFLFIVETSAASSKLEHGGRQAAFDLIYNGVYDQMQAGDTFGLWAYHQIVFAGAYPMQVWTPENRLELASNAGQFLKAQQYEKEGRLTNVLKQVMALVRGIKDVNVFIISDPGSRPEDMIGPGYTTAYKQRADEARSSKKPIITTIVARSGSISNWYVNVAGESIYLPKFAIPERPIAKIEPTNNPSQLAKATPKPRAARPAIFMKGASPAADQSSTQSNDTRSASAHAEQNVTTDPNPVGTPEANPEQYPKEPLPTSSQKTVTPGPAQLASSERTTIEPSTRQEAKQSGAAIAPPSSVAVARSPVPAEPAGPAAQASSELNAIVAPTAPDRFFSPTTMMIIGGSLLVVAAILTVVFVNRLRRPAQASFISRSMERR